MEQEKRVGKGTIVAAIIFLLIGILLNIRFSLIVLTFGFGKVHPFTPDFFRLYLKMLSNAIEPRIQVYLIMPFIVSVILFSFATKKVQNWRFILIATFLIVSALDNIFGLFQIYTMRHVLPPNSPQVIMAITVSILFFLANITGFLGFFTRAKWARGFLIGYFVICILFIAYSIFTMLSNIGLPRMGFSLIERVISAFFHVFVLYCLIEPRGKELFMVSEENA